MNSCNPFLLCFGFSEESRSIISEHDDLVGRGKANFMEHYVLHEKLGEGGYATVVKASSIKNKSRRPVAVKIVSRENLKPRDEMALRKEYEILNTLSHSNIVQAFEFFEEDCCFYVVLEYLEGGELFDRIVKKTRYDEAEAREVVCLLLSAIKYCHDNNVVHRDLKPENLLMTSIDNDSSVKLADFGLAIVLNGSEVSVPKAGTPDYVAPEVIQGKPIGKPVDMWAFGVIMFILLGGYPPFHDNNQKMLFSKISRGSYQFNPKRWSTVSNQAKDMISRLLTVDPSERLTATQAFSHDWVIQDRSLLAQNCLDDNLSELRKFNASRKLRVGIRAVMAANSFMKAGSGKDGDVFTLSDTAVTDGISVNIL